MPVANQALIPPDTQAMLDDLHACEAVLGDWLEDRGIVRGVRCEGPIQQTVMRDMCARCGKSSQRCQAFKLDGIGAKLHIGLELATNALRAHLGYLGMVVLGDVALAIDELYEPFPWPDVKSSRPRCVLIYCVGDAVIEVNRGPVRRLYTQTVIVDRVTVASINISWGASGLWGTLIECHEVLEAKPVRCAGEYNQRPMRRAYLCPLPAGHRGRCRPDPTEPHGCAIACGRPLEREVVAMADRYREERPSLVELPNSTDTRRGG